MDAQLLYNAQIVTETKTIPQGYVVIEGEKICLIKEGNPNLMDYMGIRQTDLMGDILSPGFIDLHCHGGGGSDFMDGTLDDFVIASQTHLRHGTTTIAPTTMTCPDDELFGFFELYQKAEKLKEGMPRFAGIHLEGPYFSRTQAGAQPPDLLQTPNPSHYEAILNFAQGKIFRWSLAPELEGAMALGDRLKEEGILVSIGHSDATYDVVKQSLAHGFSHLTHFYSGMSSIVRVSGSRVLGVIECGYLFDELDVEIIADGKHLPPELLQLILKNKHHEHISLVTDGMRGAGMPEGPSILGSRSRGVPVIIKNGIANMPDFSGFAGSTATTDRLVRTMVTLAGLSLHEAIAMMSLHPARLMHRENDLGSIARGKLADLVQLNSDLYTQQVWVAGHKII